MRLRGNHLIDRLCPVHAAHMINTLLRKLKLMLLLVVVVVLHKLRRIGHVLSRGELLLYWRRAIESSREVAIALPHRIMHRLASRGKPINVPRLLWRVYYLV